MTARSDQRRFGIGAVAKLTGLTDHTIRVWERRYGAVVADRAANGRRMYSETDVEKLGLLKILTDHGIAISQVAGDDLDELRARVRQLQELPARQPAERIRLAVLGDFLAAELDSWPHETAPVDVVVADGSRDRFEADLERLGADVVTVESPVLDQGTMDALQALMERAGAGAGVIVYGFGSARDAEAARRAGVHTLRAPVNVDELLASVGRAFAAAPAPRLPARPDASALQPDWTFEGPAAPRRFSQEQLSRLARTSTAIDCECPHHLAQLVGDLTAFEIYSANCASRDDEDAALHRYLHRTTAEARALIEAALVRVAAAEGLDY